MLIAFFVILLDMIGFGIMVPILAFYSLQLGAGPEMATFCMALYVIGMFISTPVLGRLSDYYGRKPILMLSMVGAVLGKPILGLAATVLMVAVRRLVSGLMAGNIAAAQAYATDVTTPENRAKAMGMIGAAFGLGFIIGPALGSYLAGDSFTDANLFLPAMLSATMSLLALLAIIFFLPESLSIENRQRLRREKRLGQARAFVNVAREPMVFSIVVACFIYNLAAGFVEVIFPLWSQGTGVAAGPKDLTALLLVAGFGMVIMQGGLIGPLTRRFGEERLVIAGSLIFATALLLMTVAGSAISYYGVMAALVGQGMGAALVLTPLQSLVSQTSSETNRGMIMGVYSSVGTLGRGIGTAVTGLAFANIHMHSSYYIGAACMVALLIQALIIKSRWAKHTASPALTGTES
jgi:MFS family permease